MIDIDDAFDKLNKASDEWLTGTFICDRCGKEKRKFGSVIMPVRGGGNRCVCCECYSDIMNQIDKIILGRPTK